jgi:molybdopterin-guanine dinucleotide biosynthesis adapter protein
MKTMDQKPFVLGFYGPSNSGKTTILIDLIKNFSNKYRIASVKITDKNISIDQEGKDTFNHAKAGSELVVFSTGSETSFVFKQKQKVEQIIDKIMKTNNDIDIVFIEGVNDEDTSKIRIGDIEERSNTIASFEKNSEEVLVFVKGLIKKHFGR